MKKLIKSNKAVAVQAAEAPVDPAEKAASSPGKGRLEKTIIGKSKQPGDEDESTVMNRAIPLEGSTPSAMDLLKIASMFDIIPSAQLKFQQDPDEDEVLAGRVPLTMILC